MRRPRETPPHARKLLPKSQHIFPHVYVPESSIRQTHEFFRVCLENGGNMGKLLSRAITRTPLHYDVETDRLCVRLASLINEVKVLVQWAIQSKKKGGLAREEAEKINLEYPDFVRDLIRQTIRKLNIPGLEMVEDVFAITFIQGREKRGFQRKISRKFRPSSATSVLINGVPIKFRREPTPIRLERNDTEN